MADYSNGKIYQICSLLTNKIYIGSTIRTLNDRFSKHKSTYKLYLDENGRKYSSFEMLKYSDCFIELIEDYPCQSKQELLIREGELQLQFIDVIVNKNIAGRTNKTYYEANKEDILKRNKTYYEANKEDIIKQIKTYYEANKEDILKQNKTRYEANKEDILKQKKEYREANKEDIRKQRKEYREANKEKISKRGKAYYEANKEDILKQSKAYYEANKL